MAGGEAVNGPGEELPVLTPRGDDCVSLHATAIASDGAAILLCGPSGAGKSGLAAQLIATGVGLISDDVTIVRREGSALIACAPPDGPEAMELRGIGIAPVPRHPPAPLRAALLLARSTARLPEAEHWPILGLPVPVLRHPYRFDTAAKLMIWLASQGNAASPPRNVARP